MNNSHIYLVQTLVLLQSLCLSAGCSPGLGATEIAPGDPSYPAPNKSPNEIIQVSATIPASLTAHFIVGYKASENSGSKCQRTVGFAVTHSIGFSMPLQLTRNGNSLTGKFALDAFQPGECSWGFAGFGYQIDGRYPVVGALVYMGAGQSPTYQLDVWCVNASVISKTFPKVCSNLVHLNRQFKDLVPDSLLIATPADQRGLDTPARIGLDTKSINVQFHDVDALRSDHR